MFRKDKEEKFGVGSVIVWEGTYLVVHCSVGSNIIKLLDLYTMEILRGELYVSDPTHLTRDEAATLCGWIDNQCTFSDFTLKPKAAIRDGNKFIIDCAY